jgi:ABC-type multidrug transport system fused ATPase/permease subunit
VWHLDVHRLAEALDANAWGEVVERSRRRGICTLVRQGLLDARARFSTPVPADVLGALEAGVGEASARLVTAPLGVLAEDLRATRGTRRRLRLLREAAFPDAAFLEARYGPQPPLLRPLLWLRRWIAGAARAAASRAVPEGQRSSLRLALALLVPRLRPHVALITIGCAAMVLQAAALLALPVQAGRFTEAWSEGGGGAATLAVLPVALAGLYALAGVFARLTLGRVELRVARALREGLVERLRALPLRWVERRASGTLLAWLGAESETLAATAAELPATLLPTLAAAVVAALLLGQRDPWIAAGALGAAPLAALLLGRVIRSLRDAAVRAVDAHASLLAELQEQIEGLATIRLFGQEEREAARLRSSEERLARAREAQLTGQAWLGPLSRLVIGGSVLASIGLAALRPEAALRTPAEWVTTLLYGLALARPLASLVALPGQIVEASAAVDRFGQAWQTAPEPRGIQLRERLGGAAQWHDVHFRHPGRPPTLLGTSLRVAPGELVALVGANGAGKTTLVRLLARLDDPDAGRITIGGRDLRTLDPRTVRRAVTLVTQRTRLFDRSLRENLAYGAPNASPDEIEEASRRAGLRDFIATLPRGYETPVGENGIALSAGQRQRVALARALLTDPPLLVLDEATSMLDADGERSFLERNRAWLRRRAVLLVTHRRASLELVDRVVALVEGRAVEEHRAGSAEADGSRSLSSGSPCGWARRPAADARLAR